MTCRLWSSAVTVALHLCLRLYSERPTTTGLNYDAAIVVSADGDHGAGSAAGRQNAATSTAYTAQEAAALDIPEETESTLRSYGEGQGTRTADEDGGGEGERNAD